MDGAMETQDDTVHQHIELLSLPAAPAAPLPANVEDIDTEDTDNPQMVAEYVTEIYSYMRDLEVRKTVAMGGVVLWCPSIIGLLCLCSPHALLLLAGHVSACSAAAAAAARCYT